MPRRDREATQEAGAPHVVVTLSPILPTVEAAEGVAEGAGGRASKPSAAAGCGGYTLLAWFSLACLVVQNSTLTLTMRASRLRRGEGELYLASSAVVVCEAGKVLASALLLYVEQGSVAALCATVRSDVLAEPLSNLPLLVPAGLYTLQNNLQYVASSNLDPAVFQVLYQMKLVTTAVMSVVMMRRPLSALQWVAVLLLTAGVVLVQLAAAPAGQRRAAAGGDSPAVGCAAVFVACLTSAGAGLYLEAIVKFTRPSVWVRNMQMAGFGLVLGLVMAWGKDGEKIREHGFLVGFNGLVCAVVLLQGVGGLLTAVVVKHADNVIKGFATGLAIIMSCLISTALFGFIITAQYCVGAFVVVASVFLYSLHQHADRWLAQWGPAAPCRAAAAVAGVCVCTALYWSQQLPLPAAAEPSRRPP